jgi:Dyp-type peroxidase family
MQPPSAAPVEPVLEMDDIQGIAVPGFLKPHHTLIGVRVAPDYETGRKFKELVAALAPQIATGTRTFIDRDDFRKARIRLKDAHPRSSMAFTKGDEGAVLVGIGFTYRGLARLTPGADGIDSEAFRAGMAARSGLLGDPASPDADGNPANWKFGGPGKELDALVVVAGDHRDPVTKRADVLQKRLEDAGLKIEYREDGDVREKPREERGREHFGFEDGVSQPAIRGRIRVHGGEQFISPRNIDAAEIPETWLYGRPGQTLIWPGEFVLGQPATSPDPLRPGPPSPATPQWTRNGSFLVFRRLRQDVGLFWRTMRDAAAEISKSGWQIDDETLAAHLVGRWPSGAPLNRVPGGDVAELGADRLANNMFNLDSDTPPLATHDDEGQKYTDPFPRAKADPLGVHCPLGAHIRKVNVRDSVSDMGGGDATYARRLLRIGIPFGDFVDGPHKYDKDVGDRGLLFLSIQASIELQFEFLQTSWANDDVRPKMPGGNDMVIGQNQPAAGHVRRCTVIDPQLAAHVVSTDQQWVVPTGGEYFFVPSISALRDVLGKNP